MEYMNKCVNSCPRVDMLTLRFVEVVLSGIYQN